MDVFSLFIQLIIENIGFLVSIFINLILLFIIFMCMAAQGSFFADSLRVKFGFLREPNLFLVFNASRRLTLEWRSFNALQNTSKYDKTSEIVLVDRTQDFQVGTSKTKRVGLFDNILNKKPNPETVYNDLGTTVNFANNKEFRTWGYPAHIIVQGENKTISPLDAIKGDPKAKLTSYAVIDAIEGWKAYYKGQFESKQLTKGLFIVGIAVIAMLIFGSIALTLNVQTSVDQFTQFFAANKDTLVKGLDQLKSIIPHVTPGPSG